MFSEKCNHVSSDCDLDDVVRTFREHPGIRAKTALRLVTDVLGPTDWLHGPGDDAALVPTDGQAVLVAGEAIWPPLLEADPFGAGVAAVVANVNDVAAMGARPLALVDTLIGPEQAARLCLEGMRFAAELYRVRVVGGHLTVRDGPPALSAFVVGQATTPLSSRNVRPGQTVLLACCLSGAMRPDFPFFSSLRERGELLRGDVELLARSAEEGLCLAAKDVSMAGLLGSLAMLLEGTGSGVTVLLDRLPCPPDVPLRRWIAAFPSFAFLLCCPEHGVEPCRRLFRDRGLACEAIGVLDGSGELRVEQHGQEALLADLNRQAVTGLQFEGTNQA
jgi:selenophosphate synthetase-related protein